jgi:hypothetical protein
MEAMPDKNKKAWEELKKTADKRLFQVLPL